MAPAGPGNAISLAKTPNFDLFWSKYPHIMLAASGEAVGLPKGQIGNSEVGHLNIGAGRVVYQDLPRISNSIKDGSFFKNSALVEACTKAGNGHTLHLIGLVSPGGVHSHQEHLYALLRLAKEKKVKNVFIHVITDGRDVKPKSALEYLEKLEAKITEIGIGKIATVSGRYYAMDRDNRWDRTMRAYEAMTEGKGDSASTATEAIENSYLNNVNDEFIKPCIVDKEGVVKDGDSVIFFNFRYDRPRQLTKAFVEPGFDNFKREKVLKNLFFATMTEYEDGLPVSAIAFEPLEIKNYLAKVISDAGLTQFHIAETEKYAHVTFFLDGGNEKPLPGEDRKMIPSPKVATYDLQPQMSAEKIVLDLTEKIGNYDFIVVNFANLDMVGHTGDIEATVKAVETVDACLGGIVIIAKDSGYDVIVTADHGNAEKMLDTDGLPWTAHTTNPVPFIYVGDKDQKRIKYKIEPRLGNIAPTVIDLLGVEKPKEMTEASLLCDN